MDKKLKVYGIPNCDTVKKALVWLRAHGQEFEFFDYKKIPPQQKQLKEWIQQAGWEALVNRKGSTWRQLDESLKEKVKSPASAIALMIEKPSVIKRPLLESAGKVLFIGFDEAEYEKIFS